MSQLKRNQDERQSRHEAQLGALGIVLAILEHDELRIRQAVQRTGEDRLLLPVLEDFRRARCEISALQARLREDWERKQKTGWE